MSTGTQGICKLVVLYTFRASIDDIFQFGSEMESGENSIWNNTPFLPMIAFLIFSPNDCFRIFYIYLGSNL